jgi:hypothetical protein
MSAANTNQVDRYRPARGLPLYGGPTFWSALDPQPDPKTDYEACSRYVSTDYYAC